MTPSNQATGRRAFLWTAALSVLAVSLGNWLPRRWLPAATTGRPFRIPGAAELSLGGALSFTIPGTAIPGVLVRFAEDTYVAFDQRCPHLGCPVQWSPERAQFECPCHKGVFEGARGGVLSGPPRRGLRRIGIERHGNEMWFLPLPTDEAGEKHERRV